jgi:hypothetical protein
MMCDNKYIIHHITPTSNDEDGLMQVFYSFVDETFFGGLNTNVAVAAFVTSYGRLRLYRQLALLKDRVLYFDTDSIIYIDKGYENPTLGDFLGEFTNELGPDEHIVEFVSAGPKNYAFKLNTGQTKCTVKGFTLNHIASLKINFDTIKEIVTEDRQRKIAVKQQKFWRNNKKWLVYTDEVEKSYGFVYDKRILNYDLTTLPYGF